ncbi:MAG TPA: SpoIID/LytB domain-containing protein [Solirubrobacteraceae bacterium]|jgi:stage II sporulation protein D|nr:SpoIID/LytB domain-containing protein [Solirubrobacteraceae bacterium]
MLAIRSTYHRPARALGACSAAGLLALGIARAAQASDLVVTGAGWGHGVGMSQDGALGYAEHGWSYRAILAHYYAGTGLGQVSPATRIRVLIGHRVHRMSLETYVRGVVSAEMPAGWPAAALEAQAVASRTYALTAHAGGSRFDVYSDTRSQAYRGKAAYTTQTDAAVAATAGQIVTYAGQPAITYFFASSGGRTEDVENVWPGSAPQPWLRGVLDPYDAGPTHSWKVTIAFATAAARLGAVVHGSFEGIEVLRRGSSPRIVSAYVLGSGGRTLVSGEGLSWRLGLDSGWAYFSVKNGAQLTAEPDRSAAKLPPAEEPSASQPAPAPTSPHDGGTPGPA